MKVVCKPSIVKQLDSLLEKATLARKLVDYIEMSKQEYEQLRYEKAYPPAWSGQPRPTYKNYPIVIKD